MEQKNTLKDKIFEGDISDKGSNVQKVLEWSLPDPQLKARLWAEITDQNSTDSLIDTRLKIEGFWRKSQLDLIEPYIEKYYAIIEEIVDKRDRNSAEVFINQLSPAFMARDEDEAAFKALLSKRTDEAHFFNRFLKKAVENISIMKQSRKLSETFTLE